MRYGIPLAVLGAAAVGFLTVMRGRRMALPRAGRWALMGVCAGPLLISGVYLHFFRTAEAASIIPPAFPAPRLLVYGSGVLEVLGAVGLCLPRFRRVSSMCVVLLLIAVFPANIYAAGRTVGGLRMPGVPVRTAMQVLYLWLMLLVGRQPT